MQIAMVFFRVEFDPMSQQNSGKKFNYLFHRQRADIQIKAANALAIDRIIFHTFKQKNN